MKRSFAAELVRGHETEVAVAEMLKARGWHIIPSYDYHGGENRAPRIHGRASGYAVPDLDVAKAGKRMWVEVKRKAVSPLFSGERRHGIDLRLAQNYREVERITGCDVWVWIFEEATGENLCARLASLWPPIGQEYRGPRMGPSGMLFFPRDRLKPIGWVDRNRDGERAG